MSSLSREEKWDMRFLAQAKEVAGWSKDPDTKVGCVLTDYDNFVIGTGYNGFPKHIADRDDRLANRDLKRKLTIHAEINAILHSKGANYANTAYIYPIPTCLPCFLALCELGVDTIVTTKRNHPLYGQDLRLIEALMKEAGIEFRRYEYE